MTVTDDIEADPASPVSDEEVKKNIAEDLKGAIQRLKNWHSGVPIIITSAKTGDGIGELLDTALKLALNPQEKRHLEEKNQLDQEQVTIATHKKKGAKDCVIL